LLRTVGLNLVTARAFGFCYAARAVTPLLPVYASMQNEDALDSGESFYMAELRRGQELLALSAQRPAIFIIDEIFRGTNYLESVSAAAAVLHTLAAQGRVVVASHHLVLASLLSDCLQPWCVRRDGGAWQLTPGLLQDTNGIALLEERGFAPAITTKANRVHTWLSDYLAHPEGRSLISLT
jgi:DNA mismatch repair ATPase MutS